MNSEPRHCRRLGQIAHLTFSSRHLNISPPFIYVGQPRRRGVLLGQDLRERSFLVRIKVSALAKPDAPAIVLAEEGEVVEFEAGTPDPTDSA